MSGGEARERPKENSKIPLRLNRVGKESGGGGIERLSPFTFYGLRTVLLPIGWGPAVAVEPKHQGPKKDMQFTNSRLGQVYAG